MKVYRERCRRRAAKLKRRLNSDLQSEIITTIINKEQL